MCASERFIYRGELENRGISTTRPLFLLLLGQSFPAFCFSFIIFTSLKQHQQQHQLNDNGGGGKGAGVPLVRLP